MEVFVYDILFGYVSSFFVKDFTYLITGGEAVFPQTLSFECRRLRVRHLEYWHPCPSEPKRVYMGGFMIIALR